MNTRHDSSRRGISTAATAISPLTPAICWRMNEHSYAEWTEDISKTIDTSEYERRKWQSASCGRSRECRHGGSVPEAKCTGWAGRSVDLWHIEDT